MSLGRFRGAVELIIVWLALLLGAGRDASASPSGQGIPEVVRSYIGAAADTISLPSPELGRARALVFLPGRTGGGQPVPLDQLGRLLWVGRRAAILDYDRAASRELTDSYEILPFPRERRAMPAPLELPPPPAEPDPRIAAGIEEIDPARCEQTAADLVAFGSRRSDGSGGFDAGAYVLDRFRSAGLSDVSYFDYNEWCDDVVAIQPGLIWPERIYVIGAHYDSYARTAGAAPGADDNASGTAGLLEIARVLSGIQFESTIVYIAFSGEEQGLVGSEAWAAWAVERGLDIRAMVNLDMLGYVAPGDAVDLDLITNGLYPDLEAFTMATIGVYLPEFPVVSGYLDGGTSDQASFWGIGVPAVFFFEDSGSYSPYIHTASDLMGISLNDTAFLRRNVQAAAAVIATLASPIRLKIAHIPIVDPAEDVGPYRLRARITSLAPLVEDSLFVRCRVDDGPLEFLHLEAEGDSGRYTAAIPRQPAGSRVAYWIHARDEGGVTGDDPPGAPERAHEFEVGFASAFSDRFEQDCGWTIGAAGDSAVSGVWARGVSIGTGAQPGADADGDSAGFCFFTGNGTLGGPIGEQDVDGGRTSLTSPPFDLSGRAGVRLEYARWFVDETRPDDTLRVFLTNDGGSTWRLLDQMGEGERAWKPVRIDSIDTLMAMTDQMRLKVVAEDRGGASLVEAAIDNLRIRGFPAPRATFAARAASGLLVSVAPNPFRDTTAILCETASGVGLVIRVLDVRGRRVATIEEGTRAGGRTWIRWDGRDGSGRGAPAGVYFIRLDSPGAMRKAMRVVKVR